MANKRDHASLAYSDTEAPPTLSSSNKRQRKQYTDNRNKQSQQTNNGQPGIDPTYGQRCAFPVDGLNASDDDLDYEDQTDALAYLRSVQQETRQIPHVVAAPKAGPQLPPELEADRGIYDNGTGDLRGYYQDGAYTAAPDTTSPLPDEGTRLDDHDATYQNQLALTEAYCTSLLTRYTSLRALLQTTPPPSAVTSLPPEHETEVGSFGPNQPTFKRWEHRLRYTDPLPAQMAAMDKGSVLRLLRVILGGKFLRRGFALRERTSRWIWALLARLPDRGELDSVEIGWVRDLGKRAVAVSISREHARALSEVVDRAQLEAFGLRSVLNEIDEEDEDEEEEAEEEEEYEGEYAEEGPAVHRDAPRANSSSPCREKHDEQGSIPVPSPQQTNSREKDAIDMDVEEGEVAEEISASQPQPGEDRAKDEQKGGEADPDIEDGEVADDPPAGSHEEDISNAIAAARARLLASIEHTDTWEETPPKSSAPEPQVAHDSVAEKLNMRTTVNMILTVAGEFYGQRDLLQFREPFASL